MLVRSTVLTVQGKYAEARADCPKLYGLVPEFYVFACTAGIDSQAGKAVAAAATLERALSTVPAADNAARAWGESLLGEIAQRRGDATAARHFQAALAADPRDLYTLGVYSDWLLDHQRATEVIPLVQNETRVDALLLRLALAQGEAVDGSCMRASAVPGRVTESGQQFRTGPFPDLRHALGLVER